MTMHDGESDSSYTFWVTVTRAFLRLWKTQYMDIGVLAFRFSNPNFPQPCRDNIHELAVRVKDHFVEADISVEWVTLRYVMR